MEKRKRIAVTLSTLGVFLILFGVSYSFFNYTRTGVANRISVGRIYFNSEQTDTITLVDAFPIDKTEVDSSNYVGALKIAITGDTTYDDGVEYVLSVTNLTNTVGNKKIPIDVVLSTNGIGDSNLDYFDNRGGNSPIYKVLATGSIFNNEQLLVGYIPKGSTGIDGNINIKAFIDKDKIAITDTYPSKTKRIVNPNMTEEEMNDCANYWVSKWYFNEINAATNFCNGTGKYSGQTFQEKLDDDSIFESYLEYLVIHNIIKVLYYDETTEDWVDGRVALTTSEWNTLQNSSLSFKVKVEANEGIWVSESGYSKVKKAILAKEADTTVQCKKITYEEDDITYLSGTNECVDMNYVWYSGKLWRITTIYPDGTMKLLTDGSITSIYWGSNKEYDGSWIYQWLNEDFYDTLVNPNNIIDINATWNYSTDIYRPPSKTETLEQQKTIAAPVGLLSAYEYYNSYRCIGNALCNGSTYDTGYLNIGYQWWLITPAYGDRVSDVDRGGYLYNSEPQLKASGVRPAIVIKSDVGFTGNGTINSPFKIIGDKEAVVNDTTLLSSRSVGEYVKFNDDLYRIVDTSNGITKLTMADMFKQSGNYAQKEFAGSPYYGKEGNTQQNYYWDYYLNNIWYNSIDPTYKNMMVDGVYYLGLYSNNINYKSTICKDIDLDSVTTKNCTRYTESDTNKIFTGKVGLPRVSEMFSSQMGHRKPETQYIFTLTPQSEWDINSVSVNGYLYTLSPGNSYNTRPSITLKPGIKITGGTGYVGGDYNSPFEISE